MTDLIDAITQTRKTATDILCQSLTNIEKKSESEIRDRILERLETHSELYETGWYDPPEGGMGILFSEHPFVRLKYDSLRKQKYSPSNNIVFEKESVGMIYASLVDRKTKMLGDIGFPIYIGKNEKIKQHIKNCYDALYKIAKYAEVGEKFSDLCSFSEDLFKNKFKATKWIIASKNLNQPTNLGHTIPGSIGENLNFSNTIEEVRETIRTNRIFIISNENFIIPKNCAFTLETRLEDINDPSMPSVFFHFIVTFDNGKKTILTNFDKIFETMGMDFMNEK